MRPGLVDIHVHALPGIDDGPRDLEGALALARAAAASGVGTVAATPHVRMDFPLVDVRKLSAYCQAVREAVQHEGIGLRLVSGAEVSLSWALAASAEELVLASYQQRGRDLLVETPAAGLSSVEAMLYELRLKGFRITLAHPERGTRVREDGPTLERLVRQGVLLQINADALTVKRRRSPAGRLAEWLCKEGLAHVLASDGHRATSWRPVTLLADAVEVASALVGEARARWMASAAPMAIIEGQALPAAPEATRRRTLLR